MISIKGITVVITGASQGIGAQIARTFAKQNVKLVLCSRNKDKLTKLADQLEITEEDILIVEADISQSSGMTKIIEEAYLKFGVIDIFINNAGVGIAKKIDDTTADEFDIIFNTNLKSVFYCFKELLPRMKKQGYGHIINISSGAGRIGIPGLSVYSASKSALNTFSEAVAGEVRNDNIKISILAPGSTNTNFMHNMSNDKTDAVTSGTIKLTVEEVADAVLNLALQNQNAWSSITYLRPLITKG